MFKKKANALEKEKMSQSPVDFLSTQKSSSAAHQVSGGLSVQTSAE